MAETARVCNRCALEQPIEEYYRSSSGRAGRFGMCRTCMGKARNARRALPEVRAKDAARGYAYYRRIGRSKMHERNFPPATRPMPQACEACGATSKKALALDHCHKTNSFRGWLCSNCNTGFGLLGDNYVEVARRIAYLARFG